MVEKIVQYKVGEAIFDDEEKAILHESTERVFSIIRTAKLHTAFMETQSLMVDLAESKDLWEAMTAYCAALEHVHNPPKSFRSIFEPGEVSGSFDDAGEAGEEDFHIKRTLFGHTSEESANKPIPGRIDRE